MKKDVMIVTGAGQIGMALARRTGFGKKIILGDKSMKNAETIAEIMNSGGYDVVPFEMDLSSREDILAIIAKALEYGEIKYLIASLKPEGEMWRMIIDSGAALKFSSRPGQKSLLDKMRYNSYNDREGEVLQERNHSV